MPFKLGLIVNPIAGIGGRVGLKGSDGLDIQKRAKALGALPEASNRAIQALQKISTLRSDVEILCYPREMGEDVAVGCGFKTRVVGSIRTGETTAEDTRRAAKEMLDDNVALLLFAGGDGTARDVYDVVGEGQVVLGIPAGVKIHSSVFATHPASAGELALRYLQSGLPIRECEVMDTDEKAFQQGLVEASLYGYLRVPFQRSLIQNIKSASNLSEKSRMESIAAMVIDQMRTNCLYILGPGTTTRAITDGLRLPKTLLGVDILLNRSIIASDVGEKELLELIDRHATQGIQLSIVVSPIGGQGFLFGRGNQQISPKVINMVGKNGIIIVSTSEKIQSLEGRPLLLDTGDKDLDMELSGYVRVITGFREEVVYRLSSNQ
jgi:predicted polyphosphate/ATP-dependent NAD kinase